MGNAGDRISFPSWICVTGYEPSEHCLNGNFKRIDMPYVVGSSQAYYYKYPHEMHDPAAAWSETHEKTPSYWRIIEPWGQLQSKGFKLTAQGCYTEEDCSYESESTANQWSPEQPTWTKMSHSTGKEMFEFEIFPITQELINQEMAVQKVLGNEIPLIDRTGWIVTEKIMQVMKSAKKCSQDKPKEL